MAAETSTISTRRLETFTDGVFSIAATLLVIDLSVEGLGTVHDNDDLWRGLLGMQDNLLAFAISFLILCMFWAIHVRQFEFIARTDSTLTLLNTLRLLGVVLIPFTTSLNAAYSDLLFARMALPVNFLAVAAIGTLQWHYAASPRAALVHGASPELILSLKRNGLLALAIGVVVVAISPFFGSWAFAVYALNPVLTALFVRNGRGRRDRAADVKKAADRRDPADGS